MTKLEVYSEDSKTSLIIDEKTKISATEFRLVDRLLATEKNGHRIRLSKWELLLLYKGQSYFIRELKSETSYEFKVIELPERADVIEIYRHGSDKRLEKSPKKICETIRGIGKPIKTRKYIGWLVEKKRTDSAVRALQKIGVSDATNRCFARSQATGINIFKGIIKEKINADYLMKYELEYVYIASFMGDPKVSLKQIMIKYNIKNIFNLRHEYLDVLGYNKFEPVKNCYRFMEITRSERHHKLPKTIIICPKQITITWEEAQLNVLRECDRNIAKDPANAMHLIKKGDILFKLHRYDAAMFYYDEALKLNKKSIININRKCSVFEAQGKYEEAIQGYDFILELDPQNLKAWIRKESIFHILGEKENEEAAHNKVIEINRKLDSEIDNFNYDLELERKANFRSLLLYD
ncbi:MAG: tetratricopeptide repeat protein [Methanothrix sp.]